MAKQITNDIKKFFSKSPLYHEFLYIENYVRIENGIVDPIDFHGLSFEYYCEEERSIKTFQLDLPSSSKSYFGDYADEMIPEDLFDLEGKLNYQIHLLGICQSCKSKQVDFLVKVYSDKNFPSNKARLYKQIGEEKSLPIDEFEDKRIKVYFTKTGVFPEQ